MIFTGLLQVEPSQFTLNVQQMVVRRDSIGVDCCGIVLETRQHWNFKATAFRQPEGHFVASKWEQIDGEDYETSIYLLRAKSSVDECAVEGFWYERLVGYDPAVWRISGVLNPF